MAFVLERERARCDRHGHPMALVTFRLPASATVKQTARVCKMLAARVRLTDEVGWIDDVRLGAVLLDTNTHGARLVAHDICRVAARHGVRLAIAVLCYPRESLARPETTHANARPARAHAESVPVNGHPVPVNDHPNSVNGHPAVHEHSLPANGHPVPVNGHPVRAAASVPSNGHPEPTNGNPLAPAPQSPRTRADLLPFVLDGIIDELLSDEIPHESLEELLARPLPRWKRALDILGASAGLLLTAPLMILSAALIRLTSPGPVLFKQQRTGLGGKPFSILKFRTMVVDAEAKKAALRAISEQDGPAFKLRNDPRVTAIGKILRKSSLDELPQLWNVLRGEMSLVGPRPLPVAEADACEQWHRRRLDVTPGLTCIWQVKGRSRVTFAQWMRMDVGYIRARTLTQDIKLIVLTIPSVIFSKGAR